MTPRGLSTGPMPCGERDIAIDFDFIEHNLILSSSDGRREMLALVPRSVAEFHAEFLKKLASLDVHVKIWPVPVEFPEVIPFDQDRKHAAYDSEAAHRLWRILLLSAQVFEEFRSSFIGKCSPVHFFWGSFDLAVTRFSGKRIAAPAPSAIEPQAKVSTMDRVMQEAYSHECISHGFWPGGSWMGLEVKEPIYYSYTVSPPLGLAEAPIRPREARFDPQLKEFVLPYEAVRQCSSPHDMLIDFMQSTYEVGADLGGWERVELERKA